MTALVLVAAFAFIISAGVLWNVRRSPDQLRPALRKRELRSIRGASPQQVCERAAAVAKLHVVLVERSGPKLRAVAGAPWKAQFGTLDELAIRACLESGEPTGMGAGQYGASDWMFVPIERQGATVAVAGLAGPHCRRRLAPDEPLTLAIQDAFVRCLNSPGLETATASNSVAAAPSLQSSHIQTA